METKTPKQIEEICKDISIISEHTKGNQSTNMRRKLKRLMKNMISSKHDLQRRYQEVLQGTRKTNHPE